MDRRHMTPEEMKAHDQLVDGKVRTRARHTRRFGPPMTETARPSDHQGEIGLAFEGDARLVRGLYQEQLRSIGLSIRFDN